MLVFVSISFFFLQAEYGIRVAYWWLEFSVCSSDLVSPYLTRAANLKTIDLISKSTAGQAEVVFNYLNSPAAGSRTEGLEKQPEPRRSREPFRSYRYEERCVGKEWLRTCSSRRST